MSEHVWVTDGLMDAEIVYNFSTEVMQKVRNFAV